MTLFELLQTLVRVPQEHWDKQAVAEDGTPINSVVVENGNPCVTLSARAALGEDE